LDLSLKLRKYINRKLCGNIKNYNKNSKNFVTWGGEGEGPKPPPSHGYAQILNL